MTGVVAMLIKSQKDLSLRWETSSTMPSFSIRLSARLPASVKPRVGALRTAGSQSVQFVPGQHGMTCADLVVEVVDHVDVLTDLAQAFDTGDNVDLACLGAFFKIIN